MDFRVPLHVKASRDGTPKVQLLASIKGALATHRGNMSISHGATRLDTIDVVSVAVGQSAQMHALRHLCEDVLLNFLLSDQPRNSEPSIVRKAPRVELAMLGQGQTKVVASSDCLDRGTL